MRSASPAFVRSPLLARRSPAVAAFSYGANEVVFRQDDPADAVLLLLSGSVKKTVVSPDGKEAVVGLYGPGSFLGESCLLGHPRRLGTVTSIAPSTIKWFAKDGFSRAVRDDPEFAETFLMHLLSLRCRVEEDLLAQLFNSSEQRLARLLLLLADPRSDADPAPLRAKVTQETLAAMIGTTRSRVSHFLGKFRRLGLIDCDREIRVRSALAALAGDQRLDM